MDHEVPVTKVRCIRSGGVLPALPPPCSADGGMRDRGRLLHSHIPRLSTLLQQQIRYGQYHLMMRQRLRWGLPARPPPQALRLQPQGGSSSSELQPQGGSNSSSSSELAWVLLWSGQEADPPPAPTRQLW